MTEKKTPPPPGTLVLVVRRTINASPERLFDAWTRSDELLAWWGPRPVRCARAEVDLRVGGRYRIDNQLPTGGLLTIEGEFTVVERPRKLVYTWSVAPGDGPPERVTVRFDPARVVELVVRRAPLIARSSDSHCLAHSPSGGLCGGGIFSPRGLS